MTLTPLGQAADDVAARVEPHLPALTWLAACLAPGRHERLVQHALTRAWRRHPRSGPEDVTERARWCAALVAESQRLDRRTGPDLSLELVVPWPGGADAEPVDLGRALRLLAEPQRRAVECQHLVGLTVAETAVVLGCPVDAVGSALAEAHVRMRQELLPTSVPAAEGAAVVGSPAGLGSDGLGSDGLGSVGSGSAGSGSAGPDSVALARARAADRAVDALLRAAGVQFRTAVPPVVFESPSSRLLMLGRRGRLGLTGGIAAVVVGIVVAGIGIARPAATPVTPLAAADPRIQGSVRPDRSPPLVEPSVPPVEVGPAAEVVGTRTGWPSTGLISAVPSTAGAAGGVRMAWEVASGHLLVGIPERLLCNDKQIRLRVDSSSALRLDLYGGIGPDQGCAGRSLRVVAFAPLPGQNQGESIVRVTGTAGTLVLPGLSGLELDPTGTGAGLPSVSGIRTIGNSPDVDVHWQPETGRLLVSARGCGAFATADLGNGTEVTVVIRPTEARCPGAAATLTHVIQIPPQPPGAPFQVVVFNSTTDRSATTDVFTVPATLLRPSSRSSATPKLIGLSAEQKKLTGIDRVGRSPDNMLHVEVDGGPGSVELRVPTAQLLSDQTILLRPSTERTGVRASGARTIGAVLDLPSVSDVHRSLVVRIGDEDVTLPAL